MFGNYTRYYRAYMKAQANLEKSKRYLQRLKSGKAFMRQKRVIKKRQERLFYLKSKMRQYQIKKYPTKFLIKQKGKKEPTEIAKRFWYERLEDIKNWYNKSKIKVIVHFRQLGKKENTNNIFYYFSFGFWSNKTPNLDTVLEQNKEIYNYDIQGVEFIIKVVFVENAN